MRYTAFLLLIISSLAFYGCNSRASGKYSDAPVEFAIQLDNSVLGVQTVASGFDVPWEIAWGPDNWIWITEQSGTISRVNPVSGEKKVLLVIPEVWRRRSTGMLGMALHPDMKSKPLLVVNYTLRRDSIPYSRLVRYEWDGDTLINEKLLMEIPANTGHNGSRVVITDKDIVLWASGDIAKDMNAQDIKSLNGKILRINLDGTIPADNPFPESPVWAWGFRNMQGLVMASNGKLYTTEHGDANDDEVNMVEMSRNYGWPKVQGWNDRPGEDSFYHQNKIADPLRAWTPTIAPAGMDYYDGDKIPEWNNTLIFTTLKQQSLFVLKLSADSKSVKQEEIFLAGKYGRFRDLCISPEGDVYVSTSNRDWNPPKGFPAPDDDRIIRIFKLDAGEIEKNKNRIIRDSASAITNTADGFLVYKQYCVSCHKEDGKGVAGSFPSLIGSALVNGDSKELASFIMKGSAEYRNGVQSTDLQMPGFGFLKDQELSSVVNYIRNNWGNRNENVSPADIQSLR